MGSYREKNSSSAISDVIFIGPAWAAFWAASKAKARGMKAKVLPTQEQNGADGLFVYEGNGEWRETTEKIFGETQIENLWSLSRRNFALAQELGLSSGALWSEAGTIWAREGGVGRKEPGLVLRRSVLEPYLSAQAGLSAVKENWDWRIRKVGPFDFEVGGERAKMVCLLGDNFSPKLFPFLGDKWIACTLSSFLYPAGKVPEGSLFLFNQGADFAVREGKNLRIGSFRSLYSDRGVGFHDEPDEVTRKNTQAFFSEMGWIAPGAGDPKRQIATLTCDGLPLIGPLPEEPGVFVVGGFSGRGANFLFAVLEKLADALAGRGAQISLEPYSTKRFT